MERLFPPTLDNAYRGRKLGLWLFGLVVAVRTLQSLVVFINGRSIALSADGIPLGPWGSVLDCGIFPEPLLA